MATQTLKQNAFSLRGEDRNATCLCRTPGCTWLREITRLGSTAVVLMAPRAQAADELEVVLVHPGKLLVPPLRLREQLPLHPRVIHLGDVSSPWSQELVKQGFRSAVQLRFSLFGDKACHLWLLSVGVLSDASAASLVWLTHCEWPALREAMFRQRSQLTPREIEALRGLSNGCSQAQIAQSMGCSERTVRFHLENAMMKLGAESSNAAIQRALLLGLA